MLFNAVPINFSVSFFLKKIVYDAVGAIFQAKISANISFSFPIFYVVVIFSDSENPCTLPESSFSRYLKDPTFRYKNFAECVDRSLSLNVNEFSWEGYGFSLVERFYPEMGQLLDEKFKVCESFTYNT